MVLRAEVLESLVGALGPIGLLDRFQVVGAVAAGWVDVLVDLKVLMARDFAGLVEGWVTTILTGLEDETAKDDPLEHKLVKKVLAGYLDEIAAVEAEVADLDSRIKAVEASGEDDENGEGAADDGEDGMSEEELKAAKSARTAAKKKLKKLKADFAERLTKAKGDFVADKARDLVLDLLKADLARQIDRRVTAHRDLVVAAVENWWDKYAVTLRIIEKDRARAAAKLDGFLSELEYA